MLINVIPYYGLFKNYNNVNDYNNLLIDLKKLNQEIIPKIGSNKSNPQIKGYKKKISLPNK
jgi:hypothetical protein